MKAKFSLPVILLATTITLSGCSNSETDSTALGATVTSSTSPIESNSTLVAPTASPITAAQEDENLNSTEPSNSDDADVTDSTASLSGSTTDVGVDSEQLVELLTYLVQEEKLARDLYVELAESSGVRQFSNIKKSEDKHISSVQQLLVNYGIADPTSGLGSGEFENNELQALYDQLLASGSLSRDQAIAAGVVVEETDIADIKKMLEQDLPADVESVLSNLLKASYNHLAAFEKA